MKSVSSRHAVRGFWLPCVLGDIVESNDCHFVIKLSENMIKHVFISERWSEIDVCCDSNKAFVIMNLRVDELNTLH